MSVDPAHSQIAGYLTMVLSTSGLGDVEAEEMAILPGMEELSALMYVNQYRQQGTYDVIILDCASSGPRAVLPLLIRRLR